MIQIRIIIITIAAALFSGCASKFTPISKIDPEEVVYSSEAGDHFLTASIGDILIESGRSRVYDSIIFPIDVKLSNPTAGSITVFRKDSAFLAKHKKNGKYDVYSGEGVICDQELSTCGSYSANNEIIKTSFTSAATKHVVAVRNYVRFIFDDGKIFNGLLEGGIVPPYGTKFYKSNVVLDEKKLLLSGINKDEVIFKYIEHSNDGKIEKSIRHNVGLDSIVRFNNAVLVVKVINSNSIRFKVVGGF